MKPSHLNHLLCLILIVFLVASCSPFKPQLRRSPEGEIPQTYSIYTPGPEHPDRWWETFGDAELNALVEEGLSGSFTLKEAWARLSQARALAVQAGSALYPDLTGTGGTSHTRQRIENGSQETRTSRDYTLGLISSYEIDLWGRIRSEREAVSLEASATREDLNAAAITVAAEVTERWINIISQRMQKRLLDKQLETNQTYLELVELRYRKAMVSALDVYQQRQIVESVRAQIPLVESQEQLLLHELAILLGKPPRTSIQISRNDLSVPEEVPATGLPADLLANRPDVRAAGLRLQAADWQVAAARADRLPAISLTAQATYGPAELDLLFDNWVLNLASNLTAPIFDGKRRAAEVDRTRAVVNENLAAYRETVFTAIKEVEDALVSESKQREHIKALELQIDAARKALEEARARYLKGIDNYLPVLTQLITVQSLDLDLIERKAEILVDRLNLYRALSGTWTKDLHLDAGFSEASGV